jgi:hypothetical protein
VTVIELRPRLISREDQDVSQAVAGFLKEEGIDVARRQQDAYARVTSFIAMVEISADWGPGCARRPASCDSRSGDSGAAAGIGMKRFVEGTDRV